MGVPLLLFQTPLTNDLDCDTNCYSHWTYKDAAHTASSHTAYDFKAVHYNKQMHKTCLPMHAMHPSGDQKVKFKQQRRKWAFVYFVSVCSCGCGSKRHRLSPSKSVHRGGSCSYMALRPDSLWKTRQLQDSPTLSDLSTCTKHNWHYLAWCMIRWYILSGASKFKSDLTILAWPRATSADGSLSNVEVWVKSCGFILWLLLSLNGTSYVYVPVGLSSCTCCREFA